ncbi:MAG: peptidylprolyl isomerase [Desulfotomaculum sp.]|nr:peptidylprolyl isomerase [Desulfotomaculum sp.]
MKLKKILPLIAILVLVFAVSGCGQNNTAAVVNGEKIALQEYNKRVEEIKNNFKEQGIDFESQQGKELENNIKKRVLDNMIEEVLIRQQAKKEGVSPTKEDVDKKLNEIKESYQTKEEYKKALKDNKISEKELQQIILNELAAQNLYNKVTADVKEAAVGQAENYYQQNKDQFTVPEKLKTRHILFLVNEEDRADIPVKRSDEEAKKLAQQVIAQLDQGADFAELAKQKSEDPGSKNTGGLYTFSPEQGMTDQNYAAAAQSLNEGEYTKQPVRSQYGYHIIKLEEVIPQEVKPFKEVKDYIIQKLTREAKLEYYRSYIEDVKEKSDIKKNVKF